MTRNEDVHGDAGVDPTGPDRYTHECRWDGDRTERPSQAIVTTVARATGRPASELRPLFEVIDPDALDSLFECNANRPAEAVDGAVTFEYEGCAVRAEAGGRVIVTRRTADE